MLISGLVLQRTRDWKVLRMLERRPPPPGFAVQPSSSWRRELPVCWKERCGSRASSMGLISVREGWRLATSLSSSSRDLAEMESTVLCIPWASREMETGLINEYRILSDVERSLSDSHIWLLNHVKAITRDGSRKGSRRSARVSEHS